MTVEDNRKFSVYFTEEFNNLTIVWIKFKLSLPSRERMYLSGGSLEKIA